MAYREAPVSMPSTIRRIYGEFRGVDFSSDPSHVKNYRSPYAVNVYKDYASGNGQAIETFPGYSVIAQLNTGQKINGMHVVSVVGAEDRFFPSTIANEALQEEAHAVSPDGILAVLT